MCTVFRDQAVVCLGESSGWHLWRQEDQPHCLRTPTLRTDVAGTDGCLLHITITSNVHSGQHRDLSDNKRLVSLESIPLHPWCLIMFFLHHFGIRISKIGLPTSVFL